ncbi:MAG: RNA methyltransferase [Clostridia bacterium]|nr:RNA methyltransferase [Clostridia bacterium]
MIITSKDNETIKHIKKLKEKKYRDEYNEFIVEGIKMIEEAIIENAKIKYIIICDDCKTVGNIPNDLMYEIAKLNCIYVAEKIFNSITEVINPQGIMAIIEKSSNKENEIDYKQDNFLILDNIQDPGNMGTILRTADSLNLNQIIVSKGSADIYNPKVVRSTMGAIFRIKVIEVENLPKIIKEMKKHKINVYATDLKTDKSIYDVDYTKAAIVIGNEANGVSNAVLNESSLKIKIPMIGKTESLNAAVATSIILYEAFRSVGKLNK